MYSVSIWGEVYRESRLAIELADSQHGALGRSSRVRFSGAPHANQLVTVNDIKCAGRLNDNIDSTVGWLK